MSDNWVVQNLENALNTWNEKLAEIWQLITQSPENFKGGTIWNVIVDIHGAVQAIGLALLVLFFVVGVMRTCGNFAEVKRPEQALKLFIRFAIAKGAVTYGLELMMALFKIVQGMISTIMNKVQQMMSEFKPTQDLHGMNAKYIYQNALQSSVFSHFADIDGNWNGLSVADVFGDKEIKVGYVNGWLSTSQNMAKIFIVLSLVIILLIAPVFSGEYGGVDNIILTSKYGKTKCATAKVLASLLSAVFITTLVVIFNLLIAVAIYGTEGLDCSILFAPIDFLEGYIPFNITCGTVLKYQILLAFMSAISVTGIVLILSAVCKSQMIAFVISAAIHVIPIMLPISETSALYRIIVLMPLFYSQYISIMSVEQMHNGMLYAVWSIPVAIALVVIGSIISHKAFSKHQVR